LPTAVEGRFVGRAGGVATGATGAGLPPILPRPNPAPCRWTKGFSEDLFGSTGAICCGAGLGGSTGAVEGVAKVNAGDGGTEAGVWVGVTWGTTGVTGVDTVA